MNVKKLWIIGIFITLASFAIFYVRQITIERVTLYHESLPKAFDGFRILQIGDFYGENFGTNQEQLVKHIQTESVNLILFTGNYTRGYPHDLAPLERVLTEIPTDVPAYFILGDTDTDALPELVEGNTFYDLFTRYNVKSLYPGIVLTRGDEQIYLTKDYYSEYYTPLEELQKRYRHWKLSSEPANLKLLEKSEEYAYLERDFISTYKKVDEPFTIQVVYEAISVTQYDLYLRQVEQLLLSVGHTDSEWMDWDISLSTQVHSASISSLTSTNEALEDSLSSKQRVQYVTPGLSTNYFKQSFLNRLFKKPVISVIELRTKPLLGEKI